MMNLSVERKILVAFAGALAIMIMIGIVSYQNTLRFDESSREVERTHEVLEKLKDVFSSIKDAETGQRGYILTGRDTYLEPYHKATEWIGLDLAELQTLVSDNEAQLQRLQQVSSLVAERIELMRRTIALRELEGFESALELILTDKGKQTMDSIRSVIAAMERGQRNLLTQRREEEQASARETVLVLLIGGVLALVVVGSALFVIHRDIVRSERLREELERAKEAAEAATRVKSQFLAHMSHEIRTPMNGIIGMTNLLLESTLTREQQESLLMVKSSADALMRVINDILDFSKIEAGKMELDQVPFNLRECIDDAIQIFAIRAEEKGIELLFQIDPNVPNGVVGDPGRLRQIIINLVGNAIKFTDRGEITVVVEREMETNDALIIHCSVSDTGRGIPADQTAKIFEAFVQGDTSTTRVFGGTGLGLSISSQLVAFMNGRIWLESKLGAGTTFHFTARLGLQPTIAPPVSSALKNKSVLVVDDNHASRKMIESTLANWGMRIQTAVGGKAALQEMDRALQTAEPFDVVMIDRRMEGMDGFELAAAIRQDSRFDGFAIVMLLSASLPEEVKRCRDMGISSYLMKPVKQSSLLDTLLGVFEARAEGKEIQSAEFLVSKQEADRRALKILVAEDNPINQRVALGILTNRGHRVMIASDGKEAVRLFESEPFDLILMDVQMPELDGLQATAAIREREKKKTTSVPIVAVTADALKGDKERYLAAGMNGYISKPFEPKELLNLIETLVLPKPSEAGYEEKRSSVLLDEGKALTLVDGNVELLTHLVTNFLQKSSNIMADIKDSIGSREAGRLEKSAHFLRGSAAYFVQNHVLRPASELEAKGASNQLEGAAELYDELDSRIHQLQGELEEFLARIQRDRSV